MRGAKAGKPSDSGHPGGERSAELRLVYFAVFLCVAGFALSAFVPPFTDFTAWLLYAQDRWLLLFGAVIVLIASWRPGSAGKPWILPQRAYLAIALLILLFCYVGHYWVLGGYALARDEQMAIFDSQIFVAHRLVQPLPAFWQTHLSALNSLFLMPAEHPIAWVSDYLPGNAALRALVGQVADPALTCPLLTAIGAVALWKCARLMWPDDREAATVAILLYLASGQVLIAGMTAYAMTAHQTLNLLWLWLFLIGRRRSDFGALLIGWLATGLHQPLFHPLFVVPFIVMLIYQRVWARAAIFALGYLCIAAFWLAWPYWIHALIEVDHSGASMVGADFGSRLNGLLHTNFHGRWASMGANLLRFAAWQPLMLLPSMGAGIVAARRNAVALALTATFILPVIVMLAIMPDQGQGFGYRYQQGVIGSAILVAVFGWHHLTARHVGMRSVLLRISAAGLVVILPIQLIMAHSYYVGFAVLDQRIASSGTDFFIVGNDDAPISGALVLNRADLSNRPIRLLADRTDVDLIGHICDRGSRVGLPTSNFYAPINDYFDAVVISRSSDRRIMKLGPALKAAGCRVVIFGGT